MSENLENYRNRLVFGNDPAPKTQISILPTTDICFNMRNIEARNWIFQLENGQDVSLPKDTLQLLLLRYANGTI